MFDICEQNCNICLNIEQKKKKKLKNLECFCTKVGKYP